MTSTNRRYVPKNRQESETDRGCFRWPLVVDHFGYGRLNLDDKWKLAHRVVWECFYGAIPKGLVIDHLCRNRACVNINHLEVVTNKENILRGFSTAAINARKTHCIYGHELIGNNLRYVKKGRDCHVCRIEKQRKRRKELRDEISTKK